MRDSQPVSSGLPGGRCRRKGQIDCSSFQLGRVGARLASPRCEGCAACARVMASGTLYCSWGRRHGHRCGAAETARQNEKKAGAPAGARLWQRRTVTSGSAQRSSRAPGRPSQPDAGAGAGTASGSSELGLTVALSRLLRADTAHKRRSSRAAPAPPMPPPDVWRHLMCGDVSAPQAGRGHTAAAAGGPAAPHTPPAPRTAVRGFDRQRQW